MVHAFSYQAQGAQCQPAVRCFRQSNFNLAVAMVFRKPVQPREVQIINRMKKIGKVPVLRIAHLLGRNKSTIYNALKTKGKNAPKKGRPLVLVPKEVRRLVTILKLMIKEAKAKREVTMAMLIKRSKAKVGARTIHRALTKKGIRFRKMRSKPRLTAKDKKTRFLFGKKNRKKPFIFWRRKMHIDCKNFPVYAKAQDRDVAAMREVRGAYRTKGQGLDESYVVVPKHMRYNTNVKSVKILGGVAKGRVYVWSDYGPKWNGQVAADCYKGPLLNGLKKAFPQQRSYSVLEDNDPTGFKSRKGTTAKKAVNINVFAIPKRSPDLNVLDYAVWKAVTMKMRKQERRFPRSKRETRAAYIARLRRAALSLPSSTISKAIGDMKRRCELVYQAKGGHFEE